MFEILTWNEFYLIINNYNLSLKKLPKIDLINPKKNIHRYWLNLNDSKLVIIYINSL